MSEEQPSEGRVQRRPREQRGGGAPRTKVYVEGRYLKHSRDLPQTVFFCPECKGHPRRRRGCEKCEGFGKLTKDSVQELIGWVLGKAAGTRKHKFHGAGREDVDVRMLGEGRPFVFELIDPKVGSVDLAEVEAEINSRNEGRLEVRGFHWTQKSRVRELKEGQFAKEYRARVAAENEPDAGALEEALGERYEVAQKTPSRVAHRRADKVRERWIEVLDVSPEQDGVLGVTLRTQHGTYVKEAVSGEGGMTSPSLAEKLGLGEAKCLELDVLAILEEEQEVADGDGAQGERREPIEVARKPRPAQRARFGAGLGGH